MTSSPEAVALPNPPNDGITSLQYIEENATSNNSGNNNNNQKSLLASTSWDGALRLHDTAAKSHVLTHAMECGPLLCMAAAGGRSGGGGGKLYTGGSDGSIRQFDIVTSSTSLIGVHCCSNNNNNNNDDDKKAACSTLSTINNSSSLIASAGWDAKFHLWDVRLSGSSKKKPVVTLDLPGKAFSMDTSIDGTKVVVATSGRKNCFIDIRSPTNVITTDNTDAEEAASTKENPPLAKSILVRDSSLKYQTRCIKFFQPYSYGVAIGSIEGRVAIEYLSDIGISPPPPSSSLSLAAPLNTKKYAFKCHRVNDIIYPVNDIAFHPIHGTFATGGADGTVVTWDGNNKKKIANIVKLQNSIACLAYNCNGSELAMASSYTFEEGERDHPREEIYIREVLESEVKPKVVVAK